jgi:hypothetical protein
MSLMELAVPRPGPGTSRTRFSGRAAVGVMTDPVMRLTTHARSDRQDAPFWSGARSLRHAAVTAPSGWPSACSSGQHDPRKIA